MGLCIMAGSHLNKMLPGKIASFWLGRGVSGALDLVGGVPYFAKGSELLGLRLPGSHG